ncbi:MAG: FMN-binding negative transcriptional regulator [Shimia sp.]
MHPNPAFRRTEGATSLAHARSVGFGTLAVNGEGAPLLSHVPFLLRDDDRTVDIHLVRSNPMLRALPSKAVLSVVGPEGYVSPDWYGVPDQVPTWNYVAVHLRGTLEQMPHGEMRDMLDRQSGHFERLLAPKPPWTTGKMTPEVLERMIRQIVPCRLMIETVDSTWKLSQNKPDDVRLSAAEHVADPALAALMRDPPA